MLHLGYETGVALWNLRKLFLVWPVACTALMLHFVASAKKVIWCDRDFESIEHMKPEKIAACLEAGADLNATDGGGRPPLDLQMV